ncbi:50S ribosomal protein L18 [Candidatus Gracilibacteria bacterium CG2_30_37_12]|nr:MAG: 50S ribosomal protein L18 [Candidatus Gracilibacteria bacterium CG2_30_37_12]
MLEKVMKRKRRQVRVRATIIGTALRPRLAVFRSNTSIYAQMIDDTAAKTLCAASDMKITTGTKQECATKVGEELAKKALSLGITTCVFDRGGFLYAGRVKKLAEAARSGGLQF